MRRKWAAWMPTSPFPPKVLLENADMDGMRIGSHQPSSASRPERDPARVESARTARASLAASAEAPGKVGREPDAVDAAGESDDRSTSPPAHGVRRLLEAGHFKPATQARLSERFGTGWAPIEPAPVAAAGERLGINIVA